MEKYQDYAIGIDLGTTYSCIGVYRNSTVEIIPNESGERTTSSVVSFCENEILVGEQTEYKVLKENETKIYAIKRIIGRDFEEKEVQEDIKKFNFDIIKEDGKIKIQVKIKNVIEKYYPEEISAKVLSKLKKSAEVYLNHEIKKVVITVPAYFTSKQKEATKNAAKIANLDVICIINEPTAAALSYGFNKNIHKDSDIITVNGEEENDNKLILVFDLGGGTLDVTLMELEFSDDSVDYTVKAHDGIMHLGGEDFDNLLTEYCIQKFKKRTGIDLNDKDKKDKYSKAKNRLKARCEHHKKILSLKDETIIDIESLAEGKDFMEKISKALFEDICKEKFKECVDLIEKVINDAKCEKEKVDEIILVGGSSKIPKIQEMISQFFNGKKLDTHLNPDEAIAFGATIKAAMELGQYESDTMLLDVCPFSLGIEIYNQNDNKNNLMSYIIKKGTKIPYSNTEIYNPVEDNQKEVKISVYEGENKYVKENYNLGKFILSNLPKGKAKDVKIHVTFTYDSEAILTVSAEERTKGLIKSITIKNDKEGLSVNDIENIKNKSKGESDFSDLAPPPFVGNDKNFKNEIIRLNNQIKKEKSLELLLEYQDNLEKYLNQLGNNIENDILKDKIIHYLKFLLDAYISILEYNNISVDKIDHIQLKVNQYLDMFKEKCLLQLPELIISFKRFNVDLYCEFCVNILSFISEKATELYKKDKKYSKNLFEEALIRIKFFEIEKKLEEIINEELKNKLQSNFKNIKTNCIESISLYKAESIQKISKNFCNDLLVTKEEFNNDTNQICHVLDKFKDAINLLETPKNRNDKLLKAMYLANVVKIEYKIFESDDYDKLLKIAEDSINLKAQAPEGCETPQPWFDDLCKLKLEIEEKIKKKEKNQLISDNEIDISEDAIKIDDEFKKKNKFEFIYFVLKNYEPNGLKEEDKYKSVDDVKNAYNIKPKKFLNKIRKYYDPIKYNGNKKEDKIKKKIMEKVAMNINKLFDELK